MDQKVSMVLALQRTPTHGWGFGATLLRVAMPVCAAILIPLQSGHAQSGSSSSDEYNQTLLNAERAIMEDLASQPFITEARPIRASAGQKAPSAEPQPRPAPAKAVVPAKVAVPVKAAPPPKKSPQAAQSEAKRAPAPPLQGKAPASHEASPETVALSRENASLRKEVDSLKSQVTKLEGDLRDTQQQLSVAETEASRLSSMVDAKARASLRQYNVPPPPAARAPVAALTQPAAIAPAPKAAADVKPPKPNVALEIATITVEKAELRAGPGKNNSSLMTLRRGSRLAVEERSGEWYRVFAPNGERAWIHASLVSFGDGAADMNDGSAVRVKGFSTNSEEEAFRRLQKLSGKE
jgi:hypothetical protein